MDEEEPEEMDEETRRALEEAEKDIPEMETVNKKPKPQPPEKMQPINPKEPTFFDKIRDDYDKFQKKRENDERHKLERQDKESARKLEQIKEREAIEARKADIRKREERIKQYQRERNPVNRAVNAVRGYNAGRNAGRKETPSMFAQSLSGRPGVDTYLEGKSGAYNMIAGGSSVLGNALMGRSGGGYGERPQRGRTIQYIENGRVHRVRVPPGANPAYPGAYPPYPQEQPSGMQAALMNSGGGAMRAIMNPGRPAGMGRSAGRREPPSMAAQALFGRGNIGNGRPMPVGGNRNLLNMAMGGKSKLSLDMKLKRR
jgi:hypothetical protein